MLSVKVDDLIGVRFKSHGRSINEGFDCYGLAIEVSKRFGHELKDIWYEKACPETFIGNADEGIKINVQFKETKELEAGNPIIFSDGNGNMVHIGILLDDERFIHADIGGVRITELEGYYRKNWKVYKWQQ